MALLKLRSLRASTVSLGTLTALVVAVAMLIAMAPSANAAPFPVPTDAVDGSGEGLLQLVNCPPGYVANYGRCVRPGYRPYRGYREGPNCPPGTKGYQGRCVPSYGGYRGGPDCPPGTKGYEGRCVPNYYWR
jgi:hypothetical protein